MPPEPQAPDPNANSKSAPAPVPLPPSPPPPAPPAPTPGQVDIDKILLPQKEVRKVESDRRVSAGVLLDQELKAGAEGLPKPEPKPAQPLAPAKPKEANEVQPLETYQADIEKVMRGGDVSVVSIAAAEAQRRAQAGSAAQQPAAPAVPLRERLTAFFKQFSMIAAGAILLGVAAAALAYVFLRPTTVPVAVAPAAPFISVDDTQTVAIANTEPARDLMSKLNTAKQDVPLSLGLIERLVPSVSSSTPSGDVVTPMDAQTFLSTLTANIPPSLLRTVRPSYLLGVHVYDANQPLLILSVDSYQDAFAGMLLWESSLQNDLAPLFTYVPGPQINEGSQASFLGTASTTATSTAPSSEPSFTPPPAFIDRIVENHDARVLQNSTGDIYLLWTFLDRNTLVITTNAATLREIISRLQEAPVTALPAQSQ